MFRKSKIFHLFSLLLITGLVFACLPAAEVQAASGETLYVANWSSITDAGVTGRPAVVKVGETYHMWYGPTDTALYHTTSTDPASFSAGTQTTYDSTPMEVASPAVFEEGGIFYMVAYKASSNLIFSLYSSNDGDSWNYVKDVFDASSFADINKIDSPFVFKDGGTFRLYFQLKNAAKTNYKIYTAESSQAITDPEFAFTIANSGNPVLIPGVSGQWDSNYVMHPWVIKDNGVYFMYYSAYGTNQVIGLAKSNDGYNWVKSQANPILGSVGEPVVLNDNGTWRMWYLGSGSVVKYFTSTGPIEISSIQTAINKATGGETILVAPGIYTEQVTIDKSVNLVGAGIDQSVIKAPETLPVASDKLSNIVMIKGAGVIAELTGFTVTGPGPSSCGSIGTGIFVYDDANANIHHNKVDSIRDAGTTISGCQNGIAIVVGRNKYSTKATATIDNNLIVGYQKGGIVIDNADSSAIITNNIITGAGTIDTTAQNGIQISRGASATLTNNTITGNSFHNETNYWNWGASGLLIMTTGNVTLGGGNTISNNDQNIYISGDGLVTFGTETIGPSSAPVDFGYDVINDATSGKDLSHVVFPGATDNYAIEQRVWHMIDENTLGMVDWGQGSDVYAYDTATLEAALLNAPAGSIIHVKNGIYEKTGAISIDRQNLTILLENGAVIENESPCFTINASYTRITSETIGGAKCVPTNGSNGIDVAAGLTNVIIEGLEIDGTGQTTGSGIHFAGAVTDVQIVNNYIHDLSVNGVTFVEQPTGVVDIQGNLFNFISGVGISSPSSLNAEYNSWGTFAEPANAGNVDYDPWTHADLYIVDSGTPWAGMVLPGNNITYTVYANLKNVTGVAFQLPLPAGFTLVSATPITGAFLPAKGSSVLDTTSPGVIAYAGYTTNSVVSMEDLPLFEFTLKAPLSIVPSSFDLAVDSTSDQFSMSPASGGPSNNVYTAALGGETLNLVTVYPELTSTDFAGSYAAGFAQQFSLTVANPVGGVLFDTPQLQFTGLPVGTILEYWDATSSAWVAVSGGALDLPASAAGTSATYLFRVTFPNAASIAATINLVDTHFADILDSLSATIVVNSNYTVTGTFSMQGRTVRSGIPVTLTMVSPALYGPFNATSLDIISGNVVFSNIPVASYVITTNQPRYLDVTVDLNKTKAVSANTALAALELRGGDANDDNAVEVGDASIIGAQYGNTGTTNNGDVNFSNVVDIFDLAIVGGNLDIDSADAYGAWIP